MSPRFPNARWVGGAFVVGVVGGFVAALVRRHPASAYRAALAEQLERTGMPAGEARESSERVIDSAQRVAGDDADADADADADNESEPAPRGDIAT